MLVTNINNYNHQQPAPRFSGKGSLLTCAVLAFALPAHVLINGPSNRAAYEATMEAKYGKPAPVKPLPKNYKLKAGAPPMPFPGTPAYDKWVQKWVR